MEFTPNRALHVSVANALSVPSVLRPLCPLCNFFRLSLFRPLRSPPMNFLRRRFLANSGTLLGASLLDALTTPLWKWKSPLLLQQSPKPNPTKSPIQFLDVAREAGLTTPNVWGNPNNKTYIIEAKGSGIAFFDYDHDGWLDIYLTNGTLLGEDWPKGQAPTTHLYKNNRDGTFTDVTEKSGIGRAGWQTGVCVGDYDNDGCDDLFCTFCGHNVLFRNNGD